MSSTSDAIERELRHVLAQLQDVDFWPPTSAIRTIVGAFRTVAQIATEPPPPSPEQVREVAADFHQVSVEVGYADGDVGDFSAATGPTVWEGDAGDTARTSLASFTRRTDTLATATGTITSVLRAFADAMATARQRHQRAYSELDFTTEFGHHLNPADYVDDLERAVRKFVAGLEDLIGSYQDARSAAAAAGNKIRNALETIDLPSAVGTDETAVETIDGWTGSQTGPLRGTVLQRADARIAAMSPSDQKQVQQLLDAAPNDQARAWILAAVASGADLATLKRFAARVDTMSPAELAELDPTTGSSYLEGNDETTCGSDSLVIAKMINDPVYALKIVDGYDASTGRQVPDPGLDPNDPIHSRFLAEANRMHDQTNAWRDHNGNPQMPWPEGLGTTPAAVANEMNGHGGAGAPGTTYQPHVIDPDNLGGEYDRIANSVSQGNPVPLFVGNGQAPRHIVLITSSNGDTMTAYDPAAGTTVTFTRSEWIHNQVSLGGWHEAWADVLPA